MILRSCNQHCAGRRTLNRRIPPPELCLDRHLHLTKPVQTAHRTTPSLHGGKRYE